VAQFFQILGAERAVDDAVVSAHCKRHSMTDDNLVAIVDYRKFRNPANS
jgi:hypothetical protein